MTRFYVSGTAAAGRGERDKPGRKEEQQGGEVDTDRNTKHTVTLRAASHGGYSLTLPNYLPLSPFWRQRKKSGEV